MRVKAPFKKIVSCLLSAALLIGALSVFALAADNAQIFNNYVAAIDNSDSLIDKMDYRDGAEDALEAYLGGGGALTDSEISKSYARFCEQKGEIDALEALCLEFIDAVDAACSGVDLSYAELAEYMASAEELLSEIDEDYVGAYLTDYKSFKAELKQKTEACDIYIAYAKAAKEAKTFAEAKQNYDSAKRAEGNIEIEDYPGLEEAAADLAAASAVMFQKIQAAQEFIRAVENISRAESVPKGIKAARAVLEENEVDVTAEGADEAMRTLRTQEMSYDRKVAQSNDLLDDVNSLIFGLLF